MKANIENKLLAVVRVRGRVGVRQNISETLIRLNLKRVNNLSLIFGTKANLGMIKKCNDFIAYGEVKSDTLKKLFEKKDIMAGDTEINEMLNGKKKAKEFMKIPITMHPPRHGYEGIKIGYTAGGALGYRGEKINELIGRMI